MMYEQIKKKNTDLKHQNIRKEMKKRETTETTKKNILYLKLKITMEVMKIIMNKDIIIKHKLEQCNHSSTNIEKDKTMIET